MNNKRVHEELTQFADKPLNTDRDLNHGLTMCGVALMYELPATSRHLFQVGDKIEALELRIQQQATYISRLEQQLEAQEVNDPKALFESMDEQVQINTMRKAFAHSLARFHEFRTSPTYLREFIKQAKNYMRGSDILVLKAIAECTEEDYLRDSHRLFRHMEALRQAQDAVSLGTFMVPRYAKVVECYEGLRDYKAIDSSALHIIDKLPPVKQNSSGTWIIDIEKMDEECSHLTSPALDRIANFMQRGLPNFFLTVYGHTDVDGFKAENLQTSSKKCSPSKYMLVRDIARVYADVVED